MAPPMPALLLQNNNATTMMASMIAPMAHDDTADDDDDWKFPLLLSCLAGASTSVGAGIVFVLSPSRIQKSMPFSLSLAASVMITVSVISIGPECVEGILEHDDHDSSSSSSSGGGGGSDGATTTTTTTNVNLGILFQRLFSFAIGCASYYLLSRLLVALPEPESFVTATAVAAASTYNSSSDFDHGDEEDQQQQQQQRQYLLRPKNKKSGSNDNNKRKDHRGAATRRTVSRDTSQLTSSQLSGYSSGDSLEKDDDYYSAGGSSCDDDDDGADKRKMTTSSSSSSPPANGNNNNNNNTNNSTSKRRQQKHEERQRSWRVAMLLFVSLLCHNFPEGLAVVASVAESKELGVTVAIGILIHNIPEGIAIAVPCMAARPDAPWLAFGLASVSGLAEPMGALLALGVLNNKNITKGSLPPLENILACVAGIMCMVAVVELYPEAYRHVRHQNYGGMLWGTLVGMTIMMATEWYLP